MEDKALRPNFFANIPGMVKEKPLTEFADEEVHLHALSQSAGWVVLRTFMEDLMSGLDQKAEASLAIGLSFEEIGKNQVVINLTKGLIKRILEKVNDAKEAVEKTDGRT